MTDQSTNFIASNGEHRNPFYQGTFEDETTEQMERRLHWATAAVEAERVVQNNKTAPQPTEQQPRLPLPDFITDPDDSDEGASLWDHGFKQGWNSCLEAVAEDMQHTEEQPDIAQLVEQQKRIVS